MTKDDIISKVYFDPAGYGSINETLKDAKKYDSSITYEDVKKWKDKHTERKTNLRGQNSFIAHKAAEEYQMDLMFFTDLKDPEYAQGLLMVDIFTKYTVVVPVKTKQIPDVKIAIEEAIKKMGQKPITVYSDNEGAFVSNIIQAYFKDNNIRHITTLGHAPVAERQIRTIKHMIYQRVEKTKQKWHEVLYAVLLTYNNKLIHSTTKMTPNEAKKPENELTVKLNLELKRKNNRIYPNVNVGDMVKVYKKKDKLDKERLSLWSKEVYRVERIDESMGQKFYKLEGKPKALMRGEILLQN
jgi:hypothetical protein